MSINITGQGSVAVYQEVLSSITYLNTASPPTKNPPRRIEMQVFDGTFKSNIATGFVNISLVSDNSLMINCSSSVPTFTEGIPDPQLVADSLTVYDTDLVINYATVILDNAQLGDEIGVDISMPGGLTVNQTSPVSIMISGQGTASQYQVTPYTMSQLQIYACTLYTTGLYTQLEVVL